MVRRGTPKLAHRSGGHEECGSRATSFQEDRRLLLLLFSSLLFSSSRLFGVKSRRGAVRVPAGAGDQARLARLRPVSDPVEGGEALGRGLRFAALRAGNVP